ncbi:Na+/H+ antiporter subunit E [Salinicoccus hispanicus]|uniref:Na+/H+ antiporter subunit E n=1 Tax=Salinicoccus hispanicus TaxID=157225 RepID=A0A6N8TYI8_9STAP|nr:Na+/H+ antiporter subunit E [Salinicoccus hispanicus]MXQ50820.1 Na+/H+ antiporter subunit E [Salinicoccus hispanicus]
MALQILINLALAFLWMFMASNFSVASFFAGYILGFLAIYMLRNFLPEAIYTKRLYAIIRLCFLFIWEMTKANIDVIKIVLSPKMDIRPGFFAYPCELEEEWSVSLLSALITLTPGTVVVAISDDRSTLYIHALNMKDKQEEIDSIKSGFENAISEVKQA